MDLDMHGSKFNSIEFEIPRALRKRNTILSNPLVPPLFVWCEAHCHLVVFNELLHAVVISNSNVSMATSWDCQNHSWRLIYISLEQYMFGKEYPSRRSLKVHEGQYQGVDLHCWILLWDEMIEYNTIVAKLRIPVPM